MYFRNKTIHQASNEITGRIKNSPPTLVFSTSGTLNLSIIFFYDLHHGHGICLEKYIIATNKQIVLNFLFRTIFTAKNNAKMESWIGNEGMFCDLDSLLIIITNHNIFRKDIWVSNNSAYWTIFMLWTSVNQDLSHSGIAKNMQLLRL